MTGILGYEFSARAVESIWNLGGSFLFGRLCTVQVRLTASSQMVFDLSDICQVCNHMRWFQNAILETFL